MIDEAYKVVQIILNKNHQGEITPERFNQLAGMSISMIFNNILNEKSLAEDKRIRGRASENLNEIEKSLSRYLVSTNINVANGEFELPSDFAFAPKNEYLYYNNVPVEEIPNSNYRYYLRGIVAPSANFPKHKKFQNTIKVFPDSINSVELVYYRRPLVPNWTYIVNRGVPVFDDSDEDYQDLDIYQQRFPEFVNNVLTLAGVHLKDQLAVQVAEAMKQAESNKDATT